MAPLGFREEDTRYHVSRPTLDGKFLEGTDRSIRSDHSARDASDSPRLFQMRPDDLSKTKPKQYRRFSGGRIARRDQSFSKRHRPGHDIERATELARKMGFASGG